MNKIVIITLELCFILAGLFAVNTFVEKVLDPNYTENWQSRTEWETEGGTRGIPRDKKVYEADIMRDRQIDRFAFFAIFGFLVAGYYCAKAASKEIRRRGVITPADGTQALDTATVYSNRRIVIMRFLSILLCMMFVITATTLIVGHPMQDINEAGLVVNKNPYFGKDDNISKILFSMYMPVALCIAPYFVFRKITNILSFRYCMGLFAAVIVIIGICILLRLPRHSGPLIASAVSGLGVFMSFNRKMDLVAKTLGM